jgi:hypothetical protein
VVHRGQQRVDADAIAAHVTVAPDLGVDRNEIALVPDLKAESAEIEDCRRAFLDLAGEGVDRSPSPPSICSLTTREADRNPQSNMCRSNRS